MTLFLLLEVSFIMRVVSVLFVLCAVALVLVILIQKGRGGGLSSAFGGGGGGLLGSKTGDFLTWVTIGFVGAFLLLAVLMAKYYRPSVGDITAPGMAPPQQGQPVSAPPPPGSEAGESARPPEVPAAPSPETSEDTAGQADSPAPTGN